MKKHKLLICGSLLGFLCTTGALFAEVKLPAIFGDHMVLQRDTTVPVWGWAAPGEAVTVTAGAVSAAAKADAAGKWMARLPIMKASATPIDLVVAGASGKKEFHDVLVGDVWMASGQSNMGYGLKRCKNSDEVLAKANRPQIRFFSNEHIPAFEPQTDRAGKWDVCTPESAKTISAVGYYFVTEIAETQKVPVGMLNVSVGATPAEAWTSLAALQADPDLKKAYADPFLAMAAQKAAQPAPENPKNSTAQTKERPGQTDKQADFEGGAIAKTSAANYRPSQSEKQMPTGLYNGMVAPLMPFAFKGAIWYQGESNSNQAALYQKLLPAMITSWRKGWGQGDFPFLIVQLPNRNKQQKDPTEKMGDWAVLRESQFRTTKAVPNAWMASAIDLGSTEDPDPNNNLHPAEKANVSHRLALIARSQVYGEKLVYSGPTLKEAKIEGNKIRLSFDHADGGLKIGAPPKTSLTPPPPTDALAGFAIAGADKKFVPANAVIEGKDTVVVSADTVKQPAFAAYGWQLSPVVNLYNGADLPAVPFRTDKE